jgi:hypothetical protein
MPCSSPGAQLALQGCQPSQQILIKDARHARLTSIDTLINSARQGAFHGLLSCLALQLFADITVTERVQCTLEGIILPTKDIVSVL